jgi:hypothetical protein
VVKLLGEFLIHPWFATVPKQPAAGPADYLGKGDYGKVPAYLGEVKAEVQRENQMIEEMIREQSRQTVSQDAKTTAISNDERQQLINALKLKWDETNKKYQKICHMVKLDTIGKVRRYAFFIIHSRNVPFCTQFVAFQERANGAAAYTIGAGYRETRVAITDLRSGVTPSGLCIYFLFMTAGIMRPKMYMVVMLQKGGTATICAGSVVLHLVL